MLLCGQVKEYALKIFAFSKDRKHAIGLAGLGGSPRTFDIVSENHKRMSNIFSLN